MICSTENVPFEWLSQYVIPRKNQRKDFLIVSFKGNKRGKKEKKTEERNRP